MPQVDVNAIDWEGTDSFPEPIATHLGARAFKRLARSGGLSQFDVNLVHLGPDAQSTLRHWHAVEDEFIYVLEGEVVLIEGDERRILRNGDVAAFPAGIERAHHVVNESNSLASFLEVGLRAPHDKVVFPDAGLTATRHNGDTVTVEHLPDADGEEVVMIGLDEGLKR